MQASLIVVNYNDRDYLDACLASLLADGGPDYEVILVDNASTDGSADHVTRAFPTVRLIRNPSNAGFGAANNVGAREARGEYLVFVNPDTVVEAGWFRPLVAALEADPQAGLATSRILLLADRERINTCGNETHYTGLTLCRGMGLERERLAEPAVVGAVSGAAFAVRRELFHALGGFDEMFFLYMEDTDLSWRARLTGYRCLYVPQSVVYHDYTLRFGPLKTYYQERNRYAMLLKNLRWGTLFVLAPALLLAELVAWGFVLLRERSRWTNKLRAYAWVIQHWQQIAAQRRRVQSLRQVRDRELVAGSTYRLAFEQTGKGRIARLAHLLFDPCFFLLRRWALLVVWW
ncbi:MAG: glycosyltransferase family 2 protein [Anaerolineae bacterium]|nr:glycosyltransferase family 2 protein [Anaerolineae bacterium]